MISIRFHAFFLVSLLCCTAQAQLSTTGFYSRTCPKLNSIVLSAMSKAVAKEPRMGASILRLFFHDCFVNGCDASILLDDTSTFTGEKNAFPNQNSVRGFEVIDAIKSNVEASCKATVSCADILALASRDAVVLLGGPSWKVALGRRDSTTASQSAANSNLPGPGSSLSALISAFAAKNMSPRDMTALSGAHTIGQARCATFRSHIYNENNINPGFAALRQRTCPSSGGDNNLAPLDLQSPNKFGTDYYQNLVTRRGLLHSDQELFNNGTQDSLVRQYSRDTRLFFRDFAAAMVKMGSLSPLTGANGQIRLNCRKGCDGSVLLDDTPTFTGEKNAFPNKNSLRGFDVIDTIKSLVDASCNATVSCADILALAAHDGAVLLGGPSWQVSLGRRDSTTASESAANNNLPSPASSLSTLVSAFAAKNMTPRDMTALSGAHTIGQARCITFRSHIYNDTNINPGFAAFRRQACPFSGGDNDLAPLDLQSPTAFDTAYYQDLMGHRGLLHSDQELYNNGTQDSLVRQYSWDTASFFRDFAAAMVKMGSLSPLTGSFGQIRLNCRKVN